MNRRFKCRFSFQFGFNKKLNKYKINRWRTIAEEAVPWSLFLDFNILQKLLDPRGYELFATKLNAMYSSILISKRNFTKISVGGPHVYSKIRLLDIFRRHGGKVQELHLFSSIYRNPQALVDLLKEVPNLRKLTLCYAFKPYGSNMVFDDLDATGLPAFAKLKKLKVVACHDRIFELFKLSKLSSLKVSVEPKHLNLHQTTGRSYHIFGKILEQTRQEQTRQPLNDFLVAQKKLTKFALCSIYGISSTLFVSFQLKELSLVDIQLDDSGYDNLLKFMGTQCKTIVKLELTRKFPAFIYEFVFEKLVNLKSLRLETETMPTDPEFFDRLKINQSVTTLILSDKTTETINPLFKHLPNVEILQLLGLHATTSYSTLEAVANNMKNLRHLEIYKFRADLFRQLIFPSLTSLKVEDFEEAGFDVFARGSPNITHLCINMHLTERALFECDFAFDGFCDLEHLRTRHLDIATIMCGLNLESLTINCSYLASSDRFLIQYTRYFFNLIRKYGSSLRSLNLNQQGKNKPLDILDFSHIPFLRFIIANDFNKDPFSLGNGAWSKTCNYENNDVTAFSLIRSRNRAISNFKPMLPRMLPRMLFK